MRVPESLAAAARQAQGFWSELNTAWLDRVTTHPELAERRTFAAIHAGNPMQKRTFQSWPVYIDPARMHELGELATALQRLIASIPARLFDNDPARLGEFYGIADLDLVSLVMSEPTRLSSAIYRSDLLHTADGMKCVEVNAGSGVGGWHMEAIEPLYQGCRAITDFLHQRGAAGRCFPSLLGLFRHFIRDTVSFGCWPGGPLNLAIVLYPQDQGYIDMHSLELYNRRYRSALAGELPGGGQVFFCGYHQLEESDDGLCLDGERIHAAFELQNEPTDRRAFRQFKAGKLNLYSGPITFLLADKRNLALLSELGEGADFSREERAVIARHLPWTRLVARSHTTFRGRRAFLPELTASLRTELVLKRANSLGGADVHLGRCCGEERWRALLERALQQGDWIVQEYLAPLPYLFQQGANGVAAFEAVWGLFAFGESFGGLLLRVQPQEQGGVINTARGAELAVPLEVSDQEDTGP